MVTKADLDAAEPWDVARLKALASPDVLREWEAERVALARRAVVAEARRITDAMRSRPRLVRWCPCGCRYPVGTNSWRDYHGMLRSPSGAYGEMLDETE